VRVSDIMDGTGRASRDDAPFAAGADPEPRPTASHATTAATATALATAVPATTHARLDLGCVAIVE
jgi:hypothetical protein